MGIQIKRAAAKARFDEALELAQSDVELPSEWTERATKVSESPSKTFIPMLGTALLAKATDQRANPLSLQASAGRRGYSARSLCKDVLVPGAVNAGIHLGTAGHEPLNNQPFYAKASVGPHLPVPTRVRPHLDYLCESLKALDKLDAGDALQALAAFLRVRLAASPVDQPWQMTGTLGVAQLREATATFVHADPEHGKRGQAFIAACLDIVFVDVRTSAVFDPSRHWPGDVAVLQGEQVTLATEVKQRAASDTELLQFIARCADKDIHRALVATLDPTQPPLPVDDLRARAWANHGVHLSILESVDEAIHHAFTWSHLPLEAALTKFPERLADRLRELEVSAEGQAAWQDAFKVTD